MGGSVEGGEGVGGGDLGKESIHLSVEHDLLCRHDEHGDCWGLIFQIQVGQGVGYADGVDCVGCAGYVGCERVFGIGVEVQ